MPRPRVRRRRSWDTRLAPRVAFLSPLPPARTGVATYSAAVLAGLSRIGFTERQAIDVIWPVERKHEGPMPWYGLGVYQLGNNVEFHRDIYRHAIQTPGLVVIHDLALDDFVKGMIAAGDPLGYKASREALAIRGRISSENVLRSEPLRIPWCAHVTRSARGLIVHSEFCRRYLEALGCKTPMFVVPHPAIERPDDLERAERRRREVRAPIEAGGGEVLVGVLGDLTAAKMIDVVLESVGRLDPSVHVVLAGRRIPGHDVDAMVAASGLGQRVTLRTDVSDDEFRSWLFASDIVVDLRHPHRGEVSGSLARALQAGRPAVVSATGTYLDWAGDLLFRVSAGRPDPGELAAVLRDLAGDSDLRTRVGARARSHMEELARAEATAFGYARAIEETLALVKDPARRALSRWAGALADIGVDAELVRRGYGLSYARNLDVFTRSS